MQEHVLKENLLDHIGYLKKWHGSVQQHRKSFSYSPNEHLINEIFKRLKIENGICVEFGAWDGIHNSNTRVLIENGWHSIQIEPDRARFLNLKKNYSNNSKVYCMNKFVDSEFNLFDNIVPIKKNIDFCSIDIDGLDLEVFETFKKNLPKVVCIEGGQMLHPNHARISNDLSKNNIQQSLSVMTQVFESKGYKLICSYQDSFFVKQEYYHFFNVSSDLMTLYLNGLLALPRFPWIKKKLDESNLKNEIIEEVISACSPINPDGTLQEKADWIDENFSSIKKLLHRQISTTTQTN